MNGIPGVTPGAGGIDPTNTGNSTGDGAGTANSAANPTRRQTQPAVGLPDTSMAAGRHSEASFTVPPASNDGQAVVARTATERATAAARLRQDTLIREAASELMSLGFEPSQIETMISSRSANGDALAAFRKLPQLCNALGIEGHAHEERMAEQQELLREKLVTLIAQGGPNAMDALQNAYFHSEQYEIGELCDLLGKLGAYGHSYEQLGEVALHNPDALAVLHNIHQLFSRNFGEQQRPHRAQQLGVLADRGGAAALETLRGDVLEFESYSDSLFDEVMKKALRETGLKDRQIDVLVFPKWLFPE